MSKREEVLICLLGAQRIYKDYAKTIQDVMDCPEFQLLSDSQLDAILRILNSPAGTYKLVMQHRGKK